MIDALGRGLAVLSVLAAHVLEIGGERVLAFVNLFKHSPFMWQCELCK